MKKVNLTSKEFLSIYTGFVFGENFSIVLHGLSKYFGSSVTTLDASRCAKIFRQQIYKSKPELIKVMNNLGNFKRNVNIDIDTQINDYVSKFEQMYGKNVEVNQFQTDELSL